MRPMMRLVMGVVVLIAILAVVAVGLPPHVMVARSLVINAPESAVFPYLNDLHRFSDWSPWSERDPQLQTTFSGPQEGKGARVDWTSALRSVGTGSMEITDSQPSHSIALLANYNGLDGTSGYEINPAGAGSKVTWTFGYDTGSSPLKRWKGLMLDGFVGKEYDAGLRRLEALIEQDRRPTGPSVGTTMPMGGTSATPEEQPSAALPQGGGTSSAPETNTPGTSTAPKEAQTATTPPVADDAPPVVQPTPPQPTPPTTSKKRKRH
jgi:hypothetical protein